MIPGHAHKQTIIAAVTLVFVLATAILPFIIRRNRLSTNMDALLPDDPWISEHLDFLRDSHIGSIAAISLEAGNHADSAKLAEFARRFAEIAGAEPLIDDVFFKVPTDKAAAALGFLCSRAPQILPPTELRELEKTLSPKGVDDLLSEHYKELTRPGALFRQKLAAADPLNLHSDIMRKLRTLAGKSGFRITVRDNGLWSSDGRHLLILARTNAPVSDAGCGEKFIRALNRCLKNADPSPTLKYIIMAGHRHAVDNRRLLKRDIAVTMTVAALGFLALFAFLFRDWRAVFVFVTPFLGMASAIGLTWLFFDSPSAIILGMGATVIGIALDYGIHVFVAARDAAVSALSAAKIASDASGNHQSAILADESGDVGDKKRDALASLLKSAIRETCGNDGVTPGGNTFGNPVDVGVAEVRRPIIFSSLTTLGVFWAFFLSSSPGYHQLAFASTCGIAVSVWISLTCLPILFKTGPISKSAHPKGMSAKIADFLAAPDPETPDDADPPRFRKLLLKWRVTAAIWAAVLALSAISAFHADFQTNIRALDGISDDLRRDEANFKKIWGESSQAAVTVKAPDLETALERQDEIAEIAEKAGIPGFQSLSVVWPSLKTRRRNAAAWDAFWTKRRVDSLKREFREVGARYSFSKQAFAPFFQNIHKHDLSANFAESPGFELFRGKFLDERRGEVRLDAFFDDSPEAVAKMRSLTSGIPGSAVVSPRRFGEYISESILNDARRVAAIAIPLIFLLAWICLRDPRNVLLAMAPVATALLLEFPAHALFGQKLNAVGLVAMIVVTGLAVDYGIFAVSALERKNARFAENAATALTMSMLTTVIGSGALLFASHPALRTVGLVVTVGVAAAWASAIFAVPALSRLVKRS